MPKRRRGLHLGGAAGRRGRRKRLRRPRRKVTRYSHQKGKVQGRIGRGMRSKSLRKRVKILENVTKKHYDSVITIDELIHTFGTTLVGQAGLTAGDSFRQMLTIQGRDSLGDMPPLSGIFKATESNTREGEKVFVTKVRLRGTIRGAFPKPWSLVEASGAASVYTPSQMAIMATSKTKVWMIVLKDKRPSVQLANGSFEANPLPNSNAQLVGGVMANTGPLESMFQWTPISGINTLTTHGYGGALRAYTSGRFTPIYTKAFELSAHKPQEEFDISLNINKTLRYLPMRAAQPAQLNVTEPLNVNYVVMFCSKHDDWPKADDGLPDGQPAAPNPNHETPRLLRMVSRTYFRDV